jgi:MazG family protein
VQIMAALRAPDGCPWDRKQTPESLRPFLLEEAFEAVEAIDRGAIGELPSELGDVLFQCVFHAQIGAERGQFTIVEAVEAITAKLIRRHPHVFTAAGRPLGRRRRRGGVGTPAAVLTQWEQIKATEAQDARTRPRVLGGLPKTLPALLRAYEIGTRAASVGFDWSTPAGVMEKVDEEVAELREALARSPARAAEEMGDLFFTLASLARQLDIEPESALRQANEKFSDRFAAMEALLERRGSSVHQATVDQLDAAWNAIKAAPRAPSTSGRRPTPRARPRRRSRR